MLGRAYKYCIKVVRRIRKKENAYRSNRDIHIILLLYWFNPMYELEEKKNYISVQRTEWFFEHTHAHPCNGFGMRCLGVVFIFFFKSIYLYYNILKTGEKYCIRFPYAITTTTNNHKKAPKFNTNYNNIVFI